MKVRLAAFFAYVASVFRRYVAALVALGPRFWFFALGLGLVFAGAARVSLSAALFITGLIVLWDVSRVPVPTSPPAPPSPRRR